MPEQKTPLKWKFETGDGLTFPSVSEGMVYFGIKDGFPSWDNHLNALDVKTGKEKWKFKTEDSICSSPIAYEGMVYFGSDDNHLYALDIKTVEEKWKFETGHSICSSPIIYEGVVYFGSWDNHLYALDFKTGKEKWNFKTGDSIRSSPIVSEGIVYFGSNDNHLYALDIKIAETFKSSEGDFVDVSKPKYIKSTYNELESMGFTAYKITYSYPGIGEYNDGGDEDSTLEIMSPWEDLDIIKRLYCKDNDLPADEVEIVLERERSLEDMASFCGHSMNDSINYIGENDPYYKTL